MTLGFLRVYVISMLDLQEPVNVWVFFKGALIQPYLIIWKNRKIKIDSINLVHTSKEGDALLYHFSLSAGGNFYRLGFDTKRLKWFLEAVEED